MLTDLTEEEKQAFGRGLEKLKLITNAWRRNLLNQPSNLTNRKRTFIFINLILTCIALTMLSTALTTALPAIVADLQISVTTGQWLTSGYSSPWLSSCR